MADTCALGLAEVGPCGDTAPYRLEITCTGCRQTRTGAVCDTHAAQARAATSMACGWCLKDGRRHEASLHSVTRTYTREDTRG